MIGYILGFFALICFALALYLFRLILLENTARKKLSLLKSDPAAFTAYWEAKYKKMRLPQTKNAALFLVTLGLYRQGEYKNAMERMRFVQKKDPALDKDALDALFYELLLKLGNTEGAASFQKKHAESIDRGSKSPWMNIQ